MRQLAMLLAICTWVATACTVSPLQPSTKRQPVLVPTSAHCTFTQTYREDQNCCVMKPYETGLDVDAAYRQAMHEYDFSKQPRPYEEAAEAYPEIYHGHQHESEAGHSYRLAGIVVPQNNVPLFRGVWLSLALQRSDSGVTKVEPTYCEVGARGMEDQRAWHQAVQTTVLTALPPRTP